MAMMMIRMVMRMGITLIIKLRTMDCQNTGFSVISSCQYFSVQPLGSTRTQLVVKE